MHFISERTLDGGVTERGFLLGDVPGLLWTPREASPSETVPLVLMGQPGGLGLDRMYPRLVARAQSTTACGIAAAALEPPGAADRTPLPGATQARTELLRAISAGVAPGEAVIDRLVLPFVDRAVPECQRALDALLALPEIGDRVGISGG